MWPDVFLQCFVFPSVPGSIHMGFFGCCCTYVPAGHDMGGSLNSFLESLAVQAVLHPCAREQLQPWQLKVFLPNIYMHI